MESDRIPPDFNTEDVSDLPTPRAQISALFQDVRSLAETEINYAKARLSYSGGIIRKAGIWAVLSLLFLVGAVIALILGLLLIVHSYWGPWVATVSIVLIFGLSAFFAALKARNMAQNLSFSENSVDD